jgi:hypothetical protein
MVSQGQGVSKKGSEGTVELVAPSIECDIDHWQVLRDDKRPRRGFRARDPNFVPRRLAGPRPFIDRPSQTLL